MKKILLMIIIVTIASFSSYAQIFLGIADGYVLYTNNSAAQNANVSVYVSGCSGGSSNGCLRSTLSQANGYYIVGNLNVEPGGNLVINATLSNDFGAATATADSYRTATVNVTLCSPPELPQLIDQEDTHSNTVILYWTSGADPNGSSTYDQFQLDSGAITNATSPRTETNLSFQAHSWRVRTCNSGCCSDFVSDSFTVQNNLPSVPILFDQPPTTQSNVLLNWTSGADADNDSVRDELLFFLENSGDNYTLLYNNTNATSPLSITNLSTLSSYHFTVRTCDFAGCSDLATDDFFTYPGCPSCPSGGGGGGRCYPDWKCAPWSPCLSGFMKRECEDSNNCFKMPEFITPCKLKIEKKEVPVRCYAGANLSVPCSAEMEKIGGGTFYLGNLSAADIVSRKAPLNETWVFDYLTVHTIELAGTARSLEFLIDGAQYVALKKFESASIDLEQDGTEDIILILEDYDNEYAVISIVKIITKEGKAESPLSYARKGNEWMWLWFFIIIFELVVILYFYYRTKNLAKRHPK